MWGGARQDKRGALKGVAVPQVLTFIFGITDIMNGAHQHCLVIPFPVLRGRVNGVESFKYKVHMDITLEDFQTKTDSLAKYTDSSLYKTQCARG